MPQNVVRRVAGSHRKNNDGGHRSDSGCFDDVDVLQSNRQSPTTGNDSCEVPQHHSPPSPKLQSPEDVGDESSELRAIIERLAEVTKNPADLYRLCFSSRLSFTPSFNANEEDHEVQETEECSTGECEQVKLCENDEKVCTRQFLNESALSSEAAQSRHDYCGNQDECVELLAIFSSFMEKANKNPAIFKQSGLAKSLMGHFSSLLSTLESAKGDACKENAPALSDLKSDHEGFNDTNGQQLSAVESWLAAKSDDQELCETTNEENIQSGKSVLSCASAPLLACTIIRGDEQDESNADVVSNGRRAVKPYSWDYGDIWEKELKRAQSSESFVLEDKDESIFQPSFEEIRDDLFQKAGLTKSPKRRSRSADARTEHHWLTAGESPFVRTVHQSTNNDDDDDIIINIGERLQEKHVFPGSFPAIDDTWASHVKDIAVETSTFKGPKPWSTIKRRPSGLGRKSTCNRSNSSIGATSFLSCRSSESDDSLSTHKRVIGPEESESSESYLSTTSSDCFTTDDTSCYDTTTSSSSPPISNRSSTAFSDCSSPSEMNDLRRVVFQNPSVQDLACSSTEMTLDQRFSRINTNPKMFPAHHNRLLPAMTSLYGSKKRYGGQHTSYHSVLNGKRSTPLLIRSDSDLNSLTRVQFVGDSYSRSNISKNLRQSRRRSPSSGNQAAKNNDTRVVSCEIIQGGSKDMSRRVNLSKENYKNDTRMTDDKYCSGSFGQSRQEEFSPLRGLSRQTRGKGRSVYNEKPVDDRSYNNYENNTLHAKLVEIKNIRAEQRCCHSSPSLDMSYHWCKSRTTNNCRRYHSCRANTDNIQPAVAKKYTTIRNNFRSSAVQALPHEKALSSKHYHHRLKNKEDVLDDQRSKPCLVTSPFRSTFHKTDEKIARNRQATRNGKKDGQMVRSKIGHTSAGGISKEPVIVKETSFVGAATFTKYQRTLKPVQRSRSCNEKDVLTKFEEAATADKIEGKDYGLPYDSHRTYIQRRDVSRRRRGRRYSEGNAGHDENHQVVSSSYCDPHRQSIQEGSYSIESAQSAHTAIKPAEGTNYHQLTDADEMTTEKNNEEEMMLRIDGKNQMVKIPEVVVTYAEENMVGLPELLQKEEQFIIKRPSKNNIASLRDSLEIIDNYTSYKEDDEKPEEIDESTIVDVPESLGAISICIDYRNKKPMSLEFHDERKEDIKEDEMEKNQTRCNEDISDSVADVASGNTAGSYGDSAGSYGDGAGSYGDSAGSYGDSAGSYGDSAGCYGDSDGSSRRSRKDHYEQQKENHEENLLKTNPVIIRGSDIEQSPVPYRRDKSIVYTDARNSFDSDTDSSVTSHVSSVSSSGSDVTVILNDEQDISNFKHISHIGIDILPLELANSVDDGAIHGVDVDDKIHEVNADNWSLALADATQSARHVKYATAPRSMSAWKTSTNEVKENKIFEVFSNDSKTSNNSFKYEHDLDNDVVYNTSGSMSSSATSSIESSKGIGASKHSKGFLSRLKGFRNSFRDKFKHISKNTEILEQDADAMNDIKVNLGSRSLPIIDRNCNEITTGSLERPACNVARSSEARKKALHTDRAKQVQHVHTNFTRGRSSSRLRNLIGSKSSEHLHNIRVNNNCNSKISAKSMEVLLETCI